MVRKLFFLIVTLFYTLIISYASKPDLPDKVYKNNTFKTNEKLSNGYEYSIYLTFIGKEFMSYRERIDKLFFLKLNPLFNKYKTNYIMLYIDLFIRSDKFENDFEIKENYFKFIDNKNSLFLDYNKLILLNSSKDKGLNTNDLVYSLRLILLIPKNLHQKFKNKEISFDFSIENTNDIKNYEKFFILNYDLP